MPMRKSCITRKLILESTEIGIEVFGNNLFLLIFYDLCPKKMLFKIIDYQTQFCGKYFVCWI